MKNRAAMAVIALVQAIFGYEWIKGGWEKVSDPNFVGGMSKTLTGFASQNPTGWYKDLLTNVGIPNATFFGWVVGYAEFIVGIALVLAAAVYLFYGSSGLRLDAISKYVAPIGSVVALLAAAFLNANFWFAAGWRSVSTDGLNAVMFLTECVLAGATVYFTVETAEHEREEEVAWEQLFNPPKTETLKEPAGIAR